MTSKFDFTAKAEQMLQELFQLVFQLAQKTMPMCMGTGFLVTNSCIMPYEKTYAIKIAIY